MATNSYFTNGTTGEQDLQESLVTEQIKMFGKDVYYIPRTLVKEDSVFGEDTLSKFEGAHLIEAYIEDAGGLGATVIFSLSLESEYKTRSPLLYQGQDLQQQ